jgi:dipeptidyl aminopeptidase/acylaminoacyl peptidase
MPRPRLVVLAGLVLLAVASCQRIGAPGAAPASSAAQPVPSGPLIQARMQHKTELLKHGPSPQTAPATMPTPRGAKKVSYPAPNGPSIAWLAIPPGTGPHPGLLVAHGGWALDDGDFESARPFLNAGFAVIVPGWRGESGNPGEFEMFYGEVEDADAALKYLANQPGVDVERLYATGHSSGGTIALLLAESSPLLKKVAACGACPDLRGAIESNRAPIYDETPFQWRSPIEADLRSPARHLKDLNCPAMLFFSQKDDENYVNQAKAMIADADRLGKSVKAEMLPGTDHFSAWKKAVPKMIAFFKAP